MTFCIPINNTHETPYQLGTESNGGNCRRWRAALPREGDKAMKRAKMKQLELPIWMLSFKA